MTEQVPGRRLTHRSDGIDLVRAGAIFVVLGMHYFGVLAAHGAVYSSFDLVVSKTFGHGYFGVTVFFVVSGFLIAATSLERNAADDESIAIAVIPFYVRRATRILPLLWAALLLGAILLRFVPPTSIAYEDIIAKPHASFTDGFWLSTLTFAFNWYRIHASGAGGGWGLTWDVLWSLAVEEQFYLVFPLVVCLMRTTIRLRFALVMLISISTVWRAWLIHSGADWIHAFTGSITCFDALAIGVLVAASRAPRPDTNVRLLAGLALFGGLVCYILGYKAVLGLGTLGMAASTALAIQAARASVSKRLAWLAPVKDVGRLSFGLYLLHPAVLLAVAPVAFRLPPALGFVVFLVACCVTAKLSAFAFEIPIEQRLRRVLLGSKAPRHAKANNRISLAMPEVESSQY